MSAGHWIKWEKGLLRKPEVAQIAAKLKIDKFQTAARLMQVWEWADDATENGIIEGVTPDMVDDVAGILGMATAMSDVRPSPWLLIDSNGVTIPNFERHNGKSAKKRATKAAVMRSARAQNDHK